jgi:hypothetical protein
MRRELRIELILASTEAPWKVIGGIPQNGAKECGDDRRETPCYSRVGLTRSDSGFHAGEHDHE